MDICIVEVVYQIVGLDELNAQWTKNYGEKSAIEGLFLSQRLKFTNKFFCILYHFLAHCVSEVLEIVHLLELVKVEVDKLQVQKVLHNHSYHLGMPEVEDFDNLKIKINKIQLVWFLSTYLVELLKLS